MDCINLCAVMEFDDWKGYHKPCVEKCECNGVLLPIKNAAIATACEFSKINEILYIFLFAVLIIILAFWKQILLIFLKFINFLLIKI